MTRPRLSFIVPFHRDLDSLARCLAALGPRPYTAELIIAADGARDDCRALAAEHGARLIAIDGPSGPAAARNAAAAAAIGDVLVFVDADVMASPLALRRLDRIFADQPQIAAVFGAYDERPVDPGLVSQYRNLSHSYVHKSSATKARTFWAGFGAVRRDAFLAVGGFDERFKRPSVEDIDLGYRLTAQGYRIVLDPTLAACHLKRWSVRSAIVTDVRDRGIPWTQLILRYEALRDDLNLRVENRVSIVLAYLMLAFLALSLAEPWFLGGIPVLAAALTNLHWPYYRFFYRRRGARFVAGAWLLHVVHHLCNGVSFAYGLLVFLSARYCGLRLPGALSPEPWSASRRPKYATG